MKQEIQEYSLYEKVRFFIDYIKVANLHATRLKRALEHCKKLIPLTSTKLSSINEQNIAFLDMATTRFGKLQDVMGAKIFPLILEILEEDGAISFRDKLNRLEKLGFIDNANWWSDLRNIRNELTQEYPDNYSLLADSLNRFLPLAEELLAFWQKLQEKLVELRGY